MTLNLRRVTGEPVPLVTVRRIFNVPIGELFAGSGVVSRSRFGGSEFETAGSNSVTENVASLWIGLERHSGPGAPSADWTPPAAMPPVEMNEKSAALSPVSFGKAPTLSLR